MSIAEGRRPAGLRGLVPALLLLLLLGACLEEAEDKCFTFNNPSDPNASSECTGGEGSSGSFSNVVITNVDTVNEVVLLINQGTLDEIMTSWTLKNDTTGLVSDIFTFPPFTLFAGNVVLINSAAGTDLPPNLFWDGGTHWGATDAALLSDDLGNPIDSCADGDPCWN